VFNKSLDYKESYRLTRLRLLLENNVPLRDTDAMSLEEYGDVVAYLSESNEADTKLANRERGLKGTGKSK
jgi:hypothetical protein